MKNIFVHLLSGVLALYSIGSCSSEGSARGDERIRERVAAAAGANAGISAERLRAHAKFLASDTLEGRAPGSRGEELTLVYLTDQYRRMGLSPGNPDGTYLQQVKLVGKTVTNSPTLSVASAEARLTFPFMEEFMGWTPRRDARVSLEAAELVFVGYGITAPEYGWDDYKGTDVAGKVIVMLVGDPPLPDSTRFGGRAMTYYGRWTYKYEVAAENGAMAAIIIHQDNAAGYPWEVVSNSWSGEQFDIPRADGGAGRCAMEGWISSPAAERLFNRAGIGLAEAYDSALSESFQPLPLGLTASVTIESAFRDTRSYNLVAKLNGSDPEHADECVIYSAHWDHLGRGNPIDGDSIYNGAVDNASGVAATLEIARAFARRKGDLKRSIVFLNTTAEESGLLGSYYYAENPLYPLYKTVGTINIDGLNVWGRTKDMVVVGFGFSEMDDYLEAAARSHGRTLRPDAEPEKGYYYRSDHFPFAKKGVPSLYAESGVKYVGRPPGWGFEVKQGYTKDRYHKPQDEFDEDWDLSGSLEDLEALFRVGLMLAVSGDFPRWSENSEFRTARDASMKNKY
jgi:Zn-dependent M28 family amino/carboxypeptidase